MLTRCCFVVTPLQDDWLKRAELAVSKGEDELAREALKRRKAYQVQQQQGVPPLAAAAAACSMVCNSEQCNVAAVTTGHWCDNLTENVLMLGLARAGAS